MEKGEGIEVRKGAIKEGRRRWQWEESPGV